MKFGRLFKAALRDEGFPQHWVDSAIPYGQLKRILKKVRQEMLDLGLEPTMLANFTPESGDASTGSRRESATDSSIGLQYKSDGQAFRPEIILYFENDLVVDATLAPETRHFLKNIVASQRGVATHGDHSEGCCGVQAEENVQNGTIRKVKIVLKSDYEFFDLIHDDLAALDKIQAEEQEALTAEILDLSKEMAPLTKPTKFVKSDMYRWRDLFDLYTQAGIFFSTRESDAGSHNSVTAVKQLTWFQENAKGIVANFKLPASHQAIRRFMNINKTLLTNLKFQEMNQVAINKILKKFDKSTKLPAQKSFPWYIKAGQKISGTMAKVVCSELAQNLIEVTPQLKDYLCPVCLEVYWRPIRLNCGHIMCIACTVEFQKSSRRACPLCRQPVIMQADQDNIDLKSQRYIQKYFPVEVREKRIENETASGREDFGIFYKHPSEYWYKKKLHKLLTRGL